MAKRSSKKKNTSNKNDLVKQVDSLVEEIERTNNFRVIDEEEIEQLEDDLENKVDNQKKDDKEKTSDSKDNKENKEDEILDVDLDDDKEKDDDIEEDESNKEDHEKKDASIEEKQSIKEDKNENEEKSKKKEESENKEESEEKATDDEEKDGPLKKDKELLKDKKINEDITLTNDYDLEFDDSRLAEVDSLDTSFLEGRLKSNKSDSRQEKVKRKTLKPIDKNKTNKEDKDSDGIVKAIIISLLILCLGSIIGFMVCYRFIKKIEVVEKKEIVEKEKRVVDQNVLFVGDSITYYYDIEKYYKGFKAVKNGTCGIRTDTILDEMDTRIYQYNPSHVFLLIGVNDFIDTEDIEEVTSKIGKIVDGIKENRPLAKIYVESIYPVNNSDDAKIDKSMNLGRNNEEISKTNKLIQAMAKEKNVEYINIYDLLYDEEEKALKLDYTKDGIHLNDKGYEIVTNELKKYIED